ncbi:hypothetical protein EVAR_62669_1 [Eumeta japonica]|uniref:Uncharacterized protein n=1 Tax=Eumeta variegata TaxID=151549 RepID=A0A4C1Z3M8_EUMVA|nr:hypothetical protein EVAR_62669_1 [Eumeta japonica]
MTPNRSFPVWALRKSVANAANSALFTTPRTDNCFYVFSERRALGAGLTSCRQRGHPASSYPVQLCSSSSRRLFYPPCIRDRGSCSARVTDGVPL